MTHSPDNLLLFTPVATTYRGANGWSSEVQRAFIAALARIGVVAAAVRSVGKSPSSAYQLRRRAGPDSGFARAWDEAQERAGERTLDQAMAGAMQIRRTEVWRHGRQVGWRTAHDNRLAYAVLRALDRRDARWAAAGLDARMLLAEITKLPNRREKCEVSAPVMPVTSTPPASLRTGLSRGTVAFSGRKKRGSGPTSGVTDGGKARALPLPPSQAIPMASSEQALAAVGAGGLPSRALFAFASCPAASPAHWTPRPAWGRRGISADRPSEPTDRPEYDLRN